MPLLGDATTFETQMRLGSLEVTLALVGVALFAARPRVRAAAEIGQLMPMDVAVEVIERRATRDCWARTPFELGRTKDVEIVLTDPEVSRRHARFDSHNGVVYVEDLASSNGTFLNGRRVTEAIEVRTGDAIDVGNTRVVVQSVRRT